MNRPPKSGARIKLKRKLRGPEAWELGASAVGLGAVLWCANRCMDWVEHRPGVRLDDPILHLLPRTDLAYLIFALLYGAMMLSFWELWGQWQRLAQALRAYLLLVVMRVFSLYLIPLDPPADLLPLRDPLVDLCSGSMGRILTRDLFFSGHVATVFILFLLSRERGHRAVLGLSSLLIALAVLIQHAQYSVDVWAAPFFALGALLLERKIFCRRES